MTNTLAPSLSPKFEHIDDLDLSCLAAEILAELVARQLLNNSYVKFARVIGKNAKDNALKQHLETTVVTTALMTNFGAK